MVSLKECLEISKSLREWGRDSPFRRLLALSVVVILLLGAQYAYLNLYLADDVVRKNKNREQEITLLGKALVYKSALDAIALCLDSTKEKSRLSGWYCDQAVTHYSRAVNKVLSQKDVDEVVKRRAFGAMKNDVSKYLRDQELARLIASPIPKEEELDFALGKTTLALWLVFIVVVVGWFYLWMQPASE